MSEILNDLINTKGQKLSIEQNKDFSNKIKMIVGKNFDDTELDNLLKLDNSKIKQSIIKKFKKIREERINLIGESQSKDLERRIFLQSIDLNWKSHIQYLEQLRQVIGLRSYGQRDPLIEYKKEAFNLFENLLEKLKFDFITILINLKIVEATSKQKESVKPRQIDPKYIGKKMRRNEPCFCGSGKKYKHCCGSI